MSFTDEDKQWIGERFDQVHTRIDQIHKRIDRAYARIEQVETALLTEFSQVDEPR